MALPTLAQQSGQIVNVSRDVGLDQKLDSLVPADLPFRDEQGRIVHMGDFFGKKPVIVNLIFYKCAGVCSLELDGMVKAFNQMQFNVGKEFEVVTVSINPKEGPELAHDKKEAYLNLYQRPEAQSGWHFLTGEQANIQALAKSIGYRYAFDLEKERFQHPAGLVILTPQGQISKYLFNSSYNPRDLRLALVEASENKIGTPVDQVLLKCLHFDTNTGKYTLAVVRLLQFGGVVTILTLGGFIFMMMRWEKRRKQEFPNTPNATSV